MPLLVYCLATVVMLLGCPPAADAGNCTSLLSATPPDLGRVLVELGDWVTGRCAEAWQTCALTPARCGEVGADCSSDVACRSGRCHQGRCSGCATDADCPSTQFCLFTGDGSVCLTRVAPGTSCLSDTMCASGTCCDQVCTASCQRVLPLGARCMDDSQCASQSCSASRGGRCAVPAGVRPCAGHHYLRASQPLTFTDAQENCARYGGHLATPRSADESRCLTEMAGTSDIWLGFSDRETEGVFQGEDGQGPVTYSNWISPQPDNYKNVQHCAVIWNTKSRGVWDDQRCNYTRHHVCQFPLPF